MRFSTSKNSVSVKVLVALSAMGATGIASAQSSSTQAATAAAVGESIGNPNLNKGLIAATLGKIGVNSAVTTANAVAGAIPQPGGGGFAALPAGINRFALPGQGGTGAAAAPGGKAWNAWFGYSRSDIAYEYNPMKSDGNVDVYLAGVDYTLKSDIVIGLAISVDRSDIDLKGTNFGVGGGKMKGRGTTYSPYIGIPLNKNWSADITAGWGQTDVDTKLAAGGGTQGKTEDDRTLFTAGLTYRQLFGADQKWMLTGRGGYIYVKDKLGAYTMTNGGGVVQSAQVTVSQVRLGGQAAYNMGMFVPYAGLTYIYDFKESNVIGAANDTDGMQGTLGIRFSAPSGLYGGLQYSSEFSRSQIKNNQWMLNLGSRF
jgi:hypothetical protein